jgi:hypothetical protein
MRHNVVIPIALVLIILVGGWAYLNQFNSTSPKSDEKMSLTDDDQNSASPTGEDGKGENWDVFKGFLPSLQGLVNASAEPEELLEFVVNTTDRIDVLLEEAEETKLDYFAQFIGFLGGLEVELQEMIDDGSSSRDLLDHVVEKMGELQKSRMEKSKR